MQQILADGAYLLQQESAPNVDLMVKLLDSSNDVIDDISEDVQLAGEIDRDCYATIHGSCKLSISRELAWGSVRVQPWMILSGSGRTASWPLGVYILTTPDNPVGQTPQTFSATGYDLLYLLNQSIREVIQKTAGANVLAAVKDVITSAGVTSPVLFDGTATAKTLAADMTWVPSSSSVPTYLDAVNDLLQTISYRGLWVDWFGTFRSEPYTAPAQRAPEYTFTADDPALSTIGVDRTVSADYWPVPNWWRFIQNGITGAPVEGAGQYTVTNDSDGPASFNAIGYYKSKWQWLDAADQASLQAQGDAIVATDKQVTTTYKASFAPFPPLWHMDVCTLQDKAAGGSFKALAHSWTLPLDGSDMTITWDIVQ